MSKAEKDEAYVVECDLRIGVYPGKTISTHPSHWKACEAMLRYNSEPPDAR